MASELYSRDILRLAASLPHGDKLELSDGSAELRAPLCGSRMRAEVALAGERVIGVSFNVNACALGQASAAIVRKNAPGEDVAAIAAIREGLANALAEDGEMPEDWPELSHLLPAREHKGRHGAILLPFDALIAAVEQARSENHA